MLKRVPLAADEVARFNRRLLENHRVAQGPPVAGDVVRATMLRLANGFAAGHAGVRPALAERLVEALDRGVCPVVRELGSLGESDLAPLADLAAGLFGDPDLAAGEGLALLNNNAFSTAAAALAVHDAGRLLDAADAAGALSLEAFAANLSILHPAIVAARPDEGLALVVGRLRRLLDGSYLWREGAARNLQDPLTFRSLPGGARRLPRRPGLRRRRLAVELNAAQGNPLVVPGEERVISVANFEVLALAAGARPRAHRPRAAADERRRARPQAARDAWSGLPTGLAVAPGTAESGLSIYAIAGEAMTAEARLLAQPVSFELASSAGAEGIEDRATMRRSAPAGSPRWPAWASASWRSSCWWPLRRSSCAAAGRWGAARGASSSWSASACRSSARATRCRPTSTDWSGSSARARWRRPWPGGRSPRAGGGRSGPDAHQEGLRPAWRVTAMGGRGRAPWWRWSPVCGSPFWPPGRPPTPC